MANQRIKANLIPSYDMINPVIHLAQYDVSDGTGKQVEIELYYGSDKYTIPSGSTVTFRGTKRDKTGYSYEITKVTDNVVTVDVKPQMTVLSGTHNAELRITNGHTISNTIKFVMDIDSSALADDTNVSETDLSDIEKASQNVDAINDVYASTKKLYDEIVKVPYVYPFNTKGMSDLYHYTERNFRYYRRGKEHRAVLHQLFYLDDVFLFGSNARKLTEATKAFIAEASRMGLSIKPTWKMICLKENREDTHIDILGYRVYHNRITMRRRDYLKCRKSLRKYKRSACIKNARTIVALS